MNDLDLYDPGDGDLVPYAPTPSPLPAASPPGLPVDWLDERAEYGQGGSVTLFGQPMPAGTTPAAARQVLNALSEAFVHDMSRALPAAHARLAVDLFKQMATAPAPRDDVVATHRYDLRGLVFLKEDGLSITAFLNALHAHGVPQSSAYTTLRWYSDLSKKVIAQQQQPQPQQRASHGSTLDDIPDEEIARQQSACLAELGRRWGPELPGKLAVVHAHMKRLPEHLRDHLEFNLLPGNLISGNSPAVIEMVYLDACGLESAPSAKGLAQQIDEIEHVLRTERKRYNRDPMLQARYRELLRLRDG